MPRQIRDYVRETTYDRRNMPPLGLRTARDYRGQIDQERIESCRLDNEIEAFECPQTLNRYEHTAIGRGGMG